VSVSSSSRSFNRWRVAAYKPVEGEKKKKKRKKERKKERGKRIILITYLNQFGSDGTAQKQTASEWAETCTCLHLAPAGRPWQMSGVGSTST
jgi:hypothetical protein